MGKWAFRRKEWEHNGKMGIQEKGMGASM